MADCMARRIWGTVAVRHGIAWHRMASHRVLAGLLGYNSAEYNLRRGSARFFVVALARVIAVM